MEGENPRGPCTNPKDPKTSPQRLTSYISRLLDPKLCPCDDPASSYQATHHQSIFEQRCSNKGGSDT